MVRSVFASLATLGLIACNGVVAADGNGLGLGDWNLGYVDAGSYYGGGGSNTQEDASVTADSSVDVPGDASFSFDASVPPGGELCPPAGDSACSWSLTPSATDCHFEVPTGGPDPLRIDPIRMFVVISTPGAADLYTDYRPTLADCDVRGGWTWGLDDGADAPTRIALCPPTCKYMSDATRTVRFMTTTSCERP